MEKSAAVRPASLADADACVAIYRPYVENTAVTFETEVPTVEQMASRIAVARDTHEWLVLENDDEVLGYAYAHAFNPRAAYRWSVETSIYMATHHYRLGGGRELYAHLLRRLAERGYRRAFAGITQPNEPSNSFHRVRVPARRPVPTRRLETRQLARRGVDAARSARRRRAQWPANLSHLIPRFRNRWTIK
jgi:phosphinothricin acetyltransferase